MIEAAAAVLFLVLTSPADVASRAPSARDLASRASEYVRFYDQRVVAIVGEERYEQRSRERVVGRAPDDMSQSARSRLAWVHLPRLDDTVAVREVFEIDGHAVQHSSRLEQLLKAPAAQLENVVRDLLNESAAYNLASGSRNINFPTFPLVYLRTLNLDRSRWRSAGREGTLTVISFEERRRPTIVRSGAGHNLRARGRFSIDEKTGRIERAEVRLDGYRLEVSFSPAERLGIWLPFRMEDTYERSGRYHYLRVDGEATYSDYRRFETEGRLLDR
jgi:hypothetical protein